MNKENAIEVKNMSKWFKVDNEGAGTLKEKVIYITKRKKEIHKVLNDINLEIKKGETVALIGTNGCGKSTLLKLMTKILYPNKGTVETNGKLTSLLELGAGFHMDFTGRENIYFNASIFGLTHKEIDERIDQIIEFSELEEFIDTPVRTYSSGMYMRLAFSVAINVDAEILLIDEILAVGDQHFQEKCYAKLHELKKSHKTIVIVTHSLNVVKELCERAVWIYKGQVMEDGNPSDVIAHYLKRTAEDYQAKKLKIMQDKNYAHKGIAHIDEPAGMLDYPSEKGIYTAHGWEISDCENAKFEICIDGKPLKDVRRVKRDDVYNVYVEEFGGFMNMDTIGWEVDLDPEKLGFGIHNISVNIIGDNDKVLSHKESNINII